MSPFAALVIFEPIFWLLTLRWKKKNFNLKRSKRILVIRLDEVGDVAMTTPFLRELRHNLPEAWIALVVKPSIYNLVEFCPYVDKVMTFDRIQSGCNVEHRWHWKELRFCLKYLWKFRFDLAILPRWDIDFYQGSFLTYLSGANFRVGYSAQVSDRKKQLSSRLDILFTHLLDNNEPKHEVEKSLDVIRFLGGEVKNDILELWQNEEDETFADEVLTSHQINQNALLIAFGPGKRDLKRRWPLSRFIELGDWLKREYQVHILVIGEKKEKSLGYKLQEHLGDTVINMAGKTTLRQAVSLLRKCRLYIGNDYGPKHMASAAGLPVIEINAYPLNGSSSHPESPKRFGPWKVPYFVVQPERPIAPCKDGCHAAEAHCILNVTVEQVKDAVKKILVHEPLIK